MTTALFALDFLLPWEFSPTAFLVIGGTAAIFAVGARRTPTRTPTRRRVAFYAGLALIYCALQTKWDFYAGHMFFVHRLQHLALHDAGPFLLAFSAPGTALACGVPARLLPRLRRLRAALRPVTRFIFDPWTATAMFIASLCFWVWPPVHFYAMISNWLYTLMNWSVVIGDIPFWWLMLDPRPYPEARVGQGMRILILTIVMVPMILVGAVIGLSRHDLYPVYEICGRFFPISPVMDQQIGGLIIWIPGSLLAVLTALIALSRAMHQSAASARARA
ncbi:MAG: cytochrome c oxidase assembly protein [Steroidobacteraceae bacterium]